MTVLRRALSVVAATLALAGCGSQSPWTQYIQTLRQSLKGSFRDTAVSRDQAASVPYSSLGYRANGGREQMLVLATDTNGEQLWTAGSHVVLLTRDGRILRSVGLSHNRGGMVPMRGDALPSPAEALKAAYRSTRLLDMPDSRLYDVTLNCVTSAAGAQNISILGTVLATRKINETCRSAKPAWSFTDTYWVDAESGFVWHSIQHMHPDGDTLQIEILRPPG